MTPAMKLFDHFGQPLRQFLLRRVGVVVAGTAMLVAGSFIWLVLRPLADQIAGDQFDLAVIKAETGLTQVFSPPQQLLGMSIGWLGGRAPDLNSPEAFNAIFKPVLTAFPHITSVVAGSSTGQGWLLLHQSGGRWLNRMTDLPAWGEGRHRLWQHGPGLPLQSQWTELQYDPRERPWYRAAMVGGGMPSSEIRWTAPYTFFTTHEPGMTASTRVRLEDGRDLVLGLDLTLKDISSVSRNAVVGKNGLLLVMTEDEKLLAVPPLPDGADSNSWLTHVLQPVAQLPLSSVRGAMRAWHASDRAEGKVLNFSLDGTRWLVNVRAYSLGQQRLWMMVLAPAADFSPQWIQMVLPLSVALLVVALFAMALTEQGSHGLIRPLQLLVENSQRIGRLEFNALEHIKSRVHEIDHLAHAQFAMAQLLSDNQAKLDAQAHELARQVQELKQTEFRLQQQNDQLGAIIENFPGAVSVVDADLRIVAFNAEFGHVFELPPALLKQPDLHYEDVVRWHAQRGDYGPGDPEQQVHERLAAARQFKAHRVELTLCNGTVLDVRGTPLPSGGFVTLYVDVSDRKQHEFELERQAHFDALTGLPNRVLMADRLRQAMPLVQRRGHQLAVLFLDLDGFKAVNDTCGHATGDQLLLLLASRMKGVLREGDTLARLGGDEFVVVLMDMDGLTSCEPILQRLLQVVGAPATIDGTEVTVTASVGLTLYPQQQEVDADQLLRQADQAMYVAKQAGKNRYHLFDAAQDLQLRGRFEGVQRLQQAFDAQEFVLYYQPKVNMRSARVVGVEALIRWQHPQRGVVGPADFLPLIEDHSLMVDLGRWVIRSALMQMAQWQAQGLRVEVSVNVAARQLQQGDFVQELAAALSLQPTVAASDLQLEVLETSALQDMARVTAIINRCADLGVHFALDDFGTGYSSLTYLKRLPASTLKIDQSFVRDMLDDADDLSILLGVLDLASSFHRDVIAEGVETVEHGRMLLQLGCDLAQGYGIARPMPAQEVLGWIAEWHGHPSWFDVTVLPRRDMPLLLAMVEHRAWIKEVESYLVGEHGVVRQLDARTCRFGQWLSSAGGQHSKSPDAVKRLAQLHERIHELVACLCELRAQGQTHSIYIQLEPLLEARDELLTQAQVVLGDGAD